MDKEYRSTDVPIENVVPTDESDKMSIQGTAIVFESRTKICTIDGVDYFEVIDSHALDGVDLSDVCLRYNHDAGFAILARTRNNSLRLQRDESGLHFEADIIDTAAGQDVYKLIKEDLVTACSFGFTVAEDTYDPATRTRRILKIERMFEISVCDQPAYENTSVRIAERSYFAAKHEIEERAKFEARKRKLILQTY